MNRPKRVLNTIKQLRTMDLATDYVPSASEAQMTLLAVSNRRNDEEFEEYLTDRLAKEPEGTVDEKLERESRLTDEEFDYWCNILEFHAPTDPLISQQKRERYGDPDEREGVLASIMDEHELEHQAFYAKSKQGLIDHFGYDPYSQEVPKVVHEEEE